MTRAYVITKAIDDNTTVSLTSLFRAILPTGAIDPTSDILDITEVRIAGAPNLVLTEDYIFVPTGSGDTQTLDIEFKGEILEVDKIADMLSVSFVAGSAGSGGGEPVGGSPSGIFITNAVPVNAGKLVNITYKPSPNQGSVASIATDDTSVRFTVEWDRSAEYQGLPSINGTPMTTYTNKTGGTYTAQPVVALSGATSIVAALDGLEYTVAIEYEELPVVSNLVFSGSYPGTQTELKSGDTFSVSITTDVNVTEIQLANESATTASSHVVTAGTSHTVTATIANRGDTAQTLPVRARAKSVSGVWSEWTTSTSFGSTAGIHTVVLNNVRPSIAISGITYPASQEALKDSEVATITNSASNYDTITYSSPNSELSIANPTTFAASKTVTRIAGTYNITTNNITITANRVANATGTTQSSVVYIAHTSPTIAVSSPTRLRSGGSDGSTTPTHTITITATQRLIQAPTLVAPKGAWQGTAFSGVSTTWTRGINVDDTVEKGAFSWGAMTAVNLAGKSVTTISTGSTYVIGGFVSRTITVPAFNNEVAMHVAATTYSKVSISWTITSLPVKGALNASAVPPTPNGWCLTAVDTNPVTIRILDTSAANSSSQDSYITIEEAI